MSNTRKAKRHVPIRNPRPRRHQRLVLDTRRRPKLTSAMLDEIAGTIALPDAEGSRVQPIIVMRSPDV